MCPRVLQTRSNFEEMSKQTESLMKKMMEVRQMVGISRKSVLVCNSRVLCSNALLCVQHKEEEGGEETGGGVSRAGYLFLMEKSECHLY